MNEVSANIVSEFQARGLPRHEGSLPARGCLLCGQGTLREGPCGGAQGGWYFGVRDLVERGARMGARLSLVNSELGRIFVIGVDVIVDWKKGHVWLKFG